MNPFKFLQYFFKNEVTFDEIQFLREKTSNIDAILQAYQIKSFRGYNVLLSKNHIQITKYNRKDYCFYYDFKNNAFSFRGECIIGDIRIDYKLSYYNNNLRLDSMTNTETYYHTEFMINLLDLDDIDVYNIKDDDIIMITLCTDKVDDLNKEFVNNFLCII